MSKIIYLDPGHGGSDPGAVNGQRREANDNLMLALAVRALLEAQGQTVLLTRDEDKTVTLTARSGAANLAGADIFVSLHRDANSSPGVNGAWVWVQNTAGAAETAMATAVMERIAAVGVQTNRGVARGNYHVCRETNMPAMLIELGFITNAEDNRLFDEKLSDYANAIAQGICDALGIGWADTEDKEEQKLYRVQVGAFKNKQYAEGFLKSVKDMGLDAFIVEG